MNCIQCGKSLEGHADICSDCRMKYQQAANHAKWQQAQDEKRQAAQEATDRFVEGMSIDEYNEYITEADDDQI